MVEETARGLKFENKGEALNFLSSIKEKFGNKIAGLDEVGRGPLAADVFCGLVILPENHGIKGIRDSKKLTPKRRRALSEEIKDRALSWSIGTATNEEIDYYGIYPATHLAAKRAIERIDHPLDYIIVDGGLNVSPYTTVPTNAVIKGDLFLEIIGAASIIAKVAHDEQLALYHEFWPEYGFSSNQGYGTAEHRKAIERYGLTPIHRRSFGICRKFAAEENKGNVQ